MTIKTNRRIDKSQYPVIPHTNMTNKATPAELRDTYAAVNQAVREAEARPFPPRSANDAVQTREAPVGHDEMNPDDAITQVQRNAFNAGYSMAAEGIPSDLAGVSLAILARDYASVYGSYANHDEVERLYIEAFGLGFQSGQGAQPQ